MAMQLTETIFLNEDFQNLIDYFRDNGNVPVAIMAVEDAFSMGGPVVSGPTKRNLVERDTCPPAFDWVSLMSPKVQWDANAELWAWPMCTEPQPGPGKE
jgi:hypothetical protein